jgi:hypothetical protein
VLTVAIQLDIDLQNNQLSFELHDVSTPGDLTQITYLSHKRHLNTSTRSHTVMVQLATIRHKRIRAFDCLVTGLRTDRDAVQPPASDQQWTLAS